MYSLFILIGIIIFLLWNNRNGFSIGNPYVSGRKLLENANGDVETYNTLNYIEPWEEFAPTVGLGGPQPSTYGIMGDSTFYDDLNSYNVAMNTIEPPIIYLGKFNKKKVGNFTWDIRRVWLISDSLVYFDNDETYKGIIPIFYNGVRATCIIRNDESAFLDAWKGKYLVITYADADNNENVIELFSDKSKNRDSQLSDISTSKIILDEYVANLANLYIMDMNTCSVDLSDLSNAVDVEPSEGIPPEPSPAPDCGSLIEVDCKYGNNSDFCKWTDEGCVDRW